MSDANGNPPKITVSEDKLYRALSEFENRLRDFIDIKLERKADLIMLNEARKDVAELQQCRKLDVERVESLERWRSYVLGAAAVATALATAALGVVLSHL
jgi:hypothetical protein